MKRSLRLLAAVAVLFVASRYSSAQSSPAVEFNGANSSPRAVEDLTSQSVPRDYAFAWQNMTQALDENRPELLDAYFTGFAKSSLEHRPRPQTECPLLFSQRRPHADRGRRAIGNANPRWQQGHTEPTIARSLHGPHDARRGPLDGSRSGIHPGVTIRGITRPFTCHANTLS
jgi:hypothetical protein